MYEWRNENRDWRAGEILRIWNIPIGGRGLSKWYKANGYKHGVMPYRITSRYSDRQKLKLQQEFCLKLIHKSSSTRSVDVELALHATASSASSHVRALYQRGASSTKVYFAVVENCECDLRFYPPATRISES